MKFKVTIWKNKFLIQSDGYQQTKIKDKYKTNRCLGALYTEYKDYGKTTYNRHEELHVSECESNLTASKEKMAFRNNVNKNES